MGQVTKKLLGNINHAELESSSEGMDASSDIARQEQRRTIIDCRCENCHYSFFKKEKTPQKVKGGKHFFVFLGGDLTLFKKKNKKKNFPITSDICFS